MFVIICVLLLSVYCYYLCIVIICALFRHDRLDYPSYPGSEILDYPVHTETRPRQGRRHTIFTASEIFSSSGGSSSFSPESEKKLLVSATVLEKEDTMKMKNCGGENEDRRPSFAEMHGEDLVRRPSITVYQLEDSDHPDIKSIQERVANITFGETA